MRTNEYSANQDLAATAMNQRIRAMNCTMSEAFGYDRIGRNAFKPGPRKIVIKTRPNIFVRMAHAIWEWV